MNMLRKEKLGLGIVWVLLLLVAWSSTAVHAFVVPLSTATAATSKVPHIPTTTALRAEQEQGGGGGGGGGPLSFLFNPYDSKIPKEIEKEIYEAEGNTPAAQERGKRIALYAVIAFVGILMAFFNGFITELRSTPMPDGGAFSLEDAGFEWVESSFLTRFFFMNKIGGGLALLTGAGAGLLAEAEFDSRRLNAERIYEELVRRRTAKQEREAPKKKKKQRASTKEKKRLKALSEVMVNDKEEEDVVGGAAKTDETVMASAEETTPSAEPEKKGGGGVFDSVKNFYQRADSMAASQALLLNKKLEDAGVLEKITDETGLKVVGKRATDKESSDEEKTSKSQ